MTSEVTRLWAFDKTIFRIRILHKGNKQTNKMQILSKILRFSQQQQILKNKVI